MNHSRGPWTLDIETINYYNSRTGEPMPDTSHWVNREENGVKFGVALVSGMVNTREDTGKLIAASPEMLDLLKEVVWEDSGLAIVPKIRELFTKLGVTEE